MQRQQSSPVNNGLVSARLLHYPQHWESLNDYNSLKYTGKSACRNQIPVIISDRSNAILNSNAVSRNIVPGMSHSDKS
jgi:hypothetical protein